MRSITFLGPILASLLLAPGVTSGALSSWYTDVPDHHAYYDGVYYGTQAGFLTGYEDGSFGPMNPVNRVEALKMILEVSEVPLEWTEVASFPDIEVDAWYINYVNTAAELDIVSGHEDGSLKPLDTVNRAEALKMLILATGLQSELPGVANDAWYTAYLQYGIDHALIVPDDTGDYLPGSPLTRGELADLIYRFKKQPFTSQVEYGIASYYGYSFDGHNTASGTALEAYGFMAAHKTLPFGTLVRVTNLDTQITVVVEVVDRGPYTEGYIIDLTPAAFEQIGALSTGLLNTRLEVLNQ
ncbi:MAG: septal ring lytic transglycosylase RlpA family protein [Candidatus Gracilibacteria bacterium]